MAIYHELWYNMYVDEMKPITDPIVDTLLYLPRETLRAGKELAAEAPRKAFKTITGITWNIVRLPMFMLMNIPLLPGPTRPDGSQDMLSLGETRSRVRNIASLSQQGKLFDSKSVRRALNEGNESEMAA
jgi:hypothetical protein|tara:strand:- start:4 stop:390 length:387 start_codon:yes stop_codon:yes gene_type:complete